MGAVLVGIGIFFILSATRTEQGWRHVGGTVVGSGCTMQVRVPGKTALVRFHVGLCPDVPVGTRVGLVYEGSRVIRMDVGNAEVDAAPSTAEGGRVAGIVLVAGGALLLLMNALAAWAPRSLPRPTARGLLVLGLEVALPAALGLIGGMQPLQPSAVGELEGVAAGAGFGIVLAAVTAFLFRRRLFRRAEIDEARDGESGGEAIGPGALVEDFGRDVDVLGPDDGA